MDSKDIDPSNLIRESYRIEGIGPSECRSIFVDWALKLSPGIDQRAALAVLLERFAGAHPDHPMTAILREGLERPTPKGRRGGRRGRIGGGG